MSSILEALKKLEREKAGGGPIDAGEDEQEEVRINRDRSGRREGEPEEFQTIRVSSTAIIAGALVFGVVLVGASVSASLIIARASAKATYPVTASAAPPSKQAAGVREEETAAANALDRGQALTAKPLVPVKPGEEVSADVSAVAEPVEVPATSELDFDPVSDAVVPETPVAAPIVPEAPEPELAAEVSKDMPKAQADIAEPEPPPVPIKVAKATDPVVEASSAARPTLEVKLPAEPLSAPTPEPSTPASTYDRTPTIPQAISPSTALPANSGEIDLNALPVLSESERIRLGLPVLKLNIVGLPNKRQPRPSALINFEKVYVGENIGRTNARLIAVDVTGVGIDVDGSRYFLPNR